ncbi:hypothetical protein MLD38_028033 [Melastoma candidum]|uniref:Uncharacterized protein n=1 Tax=Melastoma candidum TaxID=119954 RepID=A0ACB9N147_9MYRT|nr:hypothetical protein MLD38_028033 [Melastoma candidum]
MSAELDLFHSFISPTYHHLTLHACAFLLFLAALASGLLLSPGGLAWWFRKMTSPPPPSELSADIPGPSGVPILGQALDFTCSLTHRALADMSTRTSSKRLMAFSVGFSRFVISSHPETAKEILNSSAFADRPVKESAYGLMFHRAMGFAPFGEYWRNLRRISATHLFSPRRIAAFENVRSEIGLLMVNEINRVMRNDCSVEIKKILHFGSLNNVMATVFGKRYDFYGGSCLNDAAELEGMVSEGYELLGMFNWGDHFPLLGWLDLQGVRKRCKKLVERVNVFVRKIVEEHRAKMAASKFRVGRGEVNGEDDDDDGSGYFVDVLLALEKESRLTDTDMVAVLWVLTPAHLLCLVCFANFLFQSSSPPVC